MTTSQRLGLTDTTLLYLISVLPLAMSVGTAVSLCSLLLMTNWEILPVIKICWDAIKARKQVTFISILSRRTSEATKSCRANRIQCKDLRKKSSTWSNEDLRKVTNPTVRKSLSCLSDKTRPVRILQAQTCHPICRRGSAPRSRKTADRSRDVRTRKGLMGRFCSVGFSSERRRNRLGLPSHIPERVKRDVFDFVVENIRVSFWEPFLSSETRREGKADCTAHNTGYFFR